jgi:hypothetical protein
MARARLGQETVGPPAVGSAPGTTLLGQWDSWFNYWIGEDILYWLHKNFGRRIENIAVAGSTLNDVEMTNNYKNSDMRDEFPSRETRIFFWIASSSCY